MGEIDGTDVVEPVVFEQEFKTLSGLRVALGKGAEGKSATALNKARQAMDHLDDAFRAWQDLASYLMWEAAQVNNKVGDNVTLKVVDGGKKDS